MKNIILKTVAISVLSSSIVMASGWRIPEQNAASVALSGAYIANSYDASSSYYNPANMSFSSNNHSLEASLMYIKLSQVKYETDIAGRSGDSLGESFVIPTMFFTSKDYDGVRYGLSVTAPGGLSKRWDATYAKTFAEEFSLKIVEFNPTISYKMSDQISVAGGLRILYTEGVVKSDGRIRVDTNNNGINNEATDATTRITRDMEGDGIGYGYNLAIAYKPNDTTNLSATYRSNVALKEEGTATLTATDTVINASPTTVAIPASTQKLDTSVRVPLPAVFTLAIAKTFDKNTVEFNIDKTFWSKYSELDFEYGSTITSQVLKGAFDDSKEKNWKDTHAFRLGWTHQYSSNLALMAGFAIDENPAPDDTVGVELPDSDARLYSIGFDYKIDDKSSFAMGYLYDQKKERVVNNDKFDGEFKDASAQILSMGYKLNF